MQVEAMQDHHSEPSSTTGTVAFDFEDSILWVDNAEQLPVRAAKLACHSFDSIRA